MEHWKACHKKECIDITKDQTSKIPNRAPEYDELIDVIKKDAWESSKKKSEGDEYDARVIEYVMRRVVHF